MSLNLAKRSCKIIICRNRKPVSDFMLTVNSNFRSIFNRFGDIGLAGFVHPEPIFPYPIPIRDKLWGVPLK